MEILNFLETYWQALTGIVLIAIGIVKFYYDMRAVQARVALLEKSLADNYTNDTEAKTTIDEQLQVMERKFDYFTIVIEMMADKMGLKVPKFVK